VSEGSDVRTPAAAGALLLAGAAAYTLTLEGTSVPCGALPDCQRTVSFDAGQFVGLITVGGAAVAFAALVTRRPWTREVGALGGALAAVAGAYVAFVLRATLGTPLFAPFRPPVAAALLGGGLLALAVVRGPPGDDDLGLG